MRTMLERLLRHLHRAVFDTTPDEVVAFEIAGSEAVSWEAKDEWITFTTRHGVLRYDLNNFTMGELAAQLLADGITVTNINPETRHFSGITMLELAGNNALPQKKRQIRAFKDLVHVLNGAYARELRSAQNNVTAALEQMDINTANNGFLDTWGQTFGVPRSVRDDDDYRQYIPAEAFRVRVNGFAIEKAVYDETGYRITIEEPWADIFRLDISQLSGANRFYNGMTQLDENGKEIDSRVGYYLIRPVAYGYVDWDVVVPVIMRNKAAGVELMQGQIRQNFWVRDPLDGSLWTQNWSMYSTMCYSTRGHFPHLDEFHLDTDLDIPRNYKTTITSLQMSISNRRLLLGSVYQGASYINTYLAKELADRSWFQGDGIALGHHVQAYPTAERSWRQESGWSAESTWKTAFDWKVGANSSKYEDAFGCDVSSILQVVGSAQSTGIDWDTPLNWDDQTWITGSEPDPAPVFSAQPVKEALFQNGGKLEITGAAAAPANGWQWQFLAADGVTWNDVIGQNTSTLSIDSATASQEGTYRLLAFNGTSITASDEVSAKCVYLCILNDISSQADPTQIDQQHYAITLAHGNRWIGVYYYDAKTGKPFAPAGTNSSRASATWHTSDQTVAPVTGNGVPGAGGNIQGNGQWTPVIKAGHATLRVEVGNLWSELSLTVTA